MIPLGDATRSPVKFPVTTAALILANIVAFGFELSGGERFVARWSLTPADFIAGRHLSTLLTAMFLHAGILHIAGNMIFLWAFGPELEDVMTPLPYLIFYLLGGCVAGLAQVAANPASTIPTLGASGAIAAVMGGFLITYPRDRIRTVLFFSWFARIALVPAALLIGLWFVIQVISEIATPLMSAGGGVAYAAHVGGLVFGAVSVRLFESRSRLAERTADD